MVRGGNKKNKTRLWQLHSRDVGEVECRRRWEDVGVIFGARLLEAMQRGVAVVLCEALVLMAFSGQLHGGVFGKRHTHVPAMKTLAIQVAHGWGGCTRKIMFNTAKMD